MRRGNLGRWKIEEEERLLAAGPGYRQASRSGELQTMYCGLLTGAEVARREWRLELRVSGWR